MSGHPPLTRRLTLDEFMPWAAAQDGRFELLGGEVVAMAPETGAQLRAKLAALLAITRAIKAAGVPCEALPDGATVRVDDETAYEPDVTVTCGARMGDADLLAPDPVIVVEVTSPSNSHVDLVTKLADYFRVPSVRHYLIIHLRRRMIIHHRRTDDGEIAVRILPSGAIVLDPPGLTVHVEALLGE